MSLKDLRELAEDPRFIPGIYNYCDRWCERCPMTSRCLLYAQEEAAGNIPAHDMDEETLAKKLHETFAQTKQMILEIAAEQGIDLSKIDDDPEVDKIVERRKKVGDRAQEKELAKAGMKYIKMADAFFKKGKKLFKDKAEDLIAALKMELPGDDPEATAIELNDAVEIIRWYQHQIYVKIRRALSGINETGIIEGEQYPRDCDGSAKVALIGIDRSMLAWARMREHFPDKADAILDILVHLERLRRQTEAAFPAARAFHRVGFDD